MPVISLKKREKIQEQILHHLFSVSPEAHFTSKIAMEIARDEEFTKVLLLELKSKNLVVDIAKNAEGVDYSRRLRWRLSSSAFDIYSRKQ